MEGVKNTRGWSGGIYGQSCGGYWYPLWLKEHAEARGALNKEGWNRVTVMAKGQIGKDLGQWYSSRSLEGGRNIWIRLFCPSSAQGKKWNDSLAKS